MRFLLVHGWVGMVIMNWFQGKGDMESSFAFPVNRRQKEDIPYGGIAEENVGSERQWSVCQKH